MKFSATPAGAPDPGPQTSPADPGGESAGEETRVPGFRTWRGVYLFAFGCFIVWVALLTALSRKFS
jgi:hypothetical protein